MISMTSMHCFANFYVNMQNGLNSVMWALGLISNEVDLVM